LLPRRSIPPNPTPGHNTNDLIWHVIYGSSRDTAKLTVAVNASSGEFIRVEK
jgi:hypothetical protein